MRYVNEDIVLRGDEAKQFVYNLHHPNVAKIVEENRRRDTLDAFQREDRCEYQQDDGLAESSGPHHLARRLDRHAQPLACG